jgi:pyruvate dehydrogenase E1 component beta subunit
VTNAAKPNSPSASRTLLLRDGLNEALHQEMARDERVFCIGVGIAERGGSYKVTDGLLAEFGPQRCIDTPIAEASIVGAAVGAAITGMRPVVEVLFVDFTLLTMDQVVNQAAKYRLMSGGARSVPMVLRTQGGVGDGVAAQHSQSLEGLFYHIPGLKLVMPSTPRDARGLLVSAIRDDDPVIFLEHKALYMAEGPVPVDEEVIPFGVADVKRSGRDCTLIAWSNMVPRSLTAAEELASAHGIDVEVIDPRTLVPLDRQTILESVCRTEHVVIVQEAVRRGGVAADIASIIQADAFDYLDAPVEIVAGRNIPIPYNRTLEQAYIPQTADIVAAVRRAVYA